MTLISVSDRVMLSGVSGIAIINTDGMFFGKTSGRVRMPGVTLTTPSFRETGVCTGITLRGY